MNVSATQSALSEAHTDGPWTFEELRGDDGLGYIASEHADVPCGHIIHAGVAGLPADENRANARLIAAAPDLLAALLVAQAALSDGAFEGPLVDAALRKIDAALSKAVRS